MGLRQSQLQEDTCLLRVQGIAIDEMLINVGLLSRNDGASTYTGTADYNNTSSRCFSKSSLGILVYRAITRASVDYAFDTSLDSGIHKKGIVIGRTIDHLN